MNSYIINIKKVQNSILKKQANDSNLTVENYLENVIDNHLFLIFKNDFLDYQQKKNGNLNNIVDENLKNYYKKFCNGYSIEEIEL